MADCYQLSINNATAQQYDVDATFCDGEDCNVYSRTVAPMTSETITSQSPYALKSVKIDGTVELLPGDCDDSLPNTQACLRDTCILELTPKIP